MTSSKKRLNLAADMGISSSTTDVDTCEDEYPWFHICQWACETLPSGSVMKYDVNIVKVRMLLA